MFYFGTNNVNGETLLNLGVQQMSESLKQSKCDSHYASCNTGLADILC